MAWNLAGLSLLAPVVAPLAGKLIDLFDVGRRLKTASPFVEKLLASLILLIMVSIFLMIIVAVAFCAAVAGLYFWIEPGYGPVAAFVAAALLVIGVAIIGVSVGRKLWRNVRQNIDLIKHNGRPEGAQKPEGVINAFTEGFRAGRKL